MCIGGAIDRISSDLGTSKLDDRIDMSLKLDKTSYFSSVKLTGICGVINLVFYFLSVSQHVDKYLAYMSSAIFLALNLFDSARLGSETPQPIL